MKKLKIANSTKLYISIIVLFFTLIFQIIIINKLDCYEKQLNSKKNLNKTIITSSGNLQLGEMSTYSQENTSDSSTEISTEFLATEETQSSRNETETIPAPPKKEEILKNSIFVGDSRIECLENFTIAGEYSTFCCQIGMNINDIKDIEFIANNEKINLINAISKYKYKNIIISLGYNELGWNKPDIFISKYSELIEQIKTLSPDSNIYILSILNIGKDALVSNQFENNERISNYNILIKEMCISRNLNFIDLNPDFINNEGYIPDDYTTDGIHLNASQLEIYLDKLIENMATR